MEIGFSQDGIEVLDFRTRHGYLKLDFVEDPEPGGALYTYKRGEPHITGYDCLVRLPSNRVGFCTYPADTAKRPQFSFPFVSFSDPVRAAAWWKSQLEAIEYFEIKHKKEWEESAPN